MTNQQILESIKEVLLNQENYDEELTPHWKYLTKSFFLYEDLLELNHRDAIIFYSDLFSGQGLGGPLTLYPPWCFLNTSSREKIKHLHDLCLIEEKYSII